jgi:hypothetical protein
MHSFKIFVVFTSLPLTAAIFMLLKRQGFGTYQDTVDSIGMLLIQLRPSNDVRNWSVWLAYKGRDRMMDALSLLAGHSVLVNLSEATRLLSWHSSWWFIKRVVSILSCYMNFEVVFPFSQPPIVCRVLHCELCSEDTVRCPSLNLSDLRNW